MKLIVIVSALLSVAVSAAPPPTPKGKASAPTKAKPPAAKASAAPAAKKPATKAPAYAAKGKAPVAAPARPGVNSRAVYSRTPIRSARAQAAGRRAPAVRQPVVYTPQVPSQDRYREIQQALADKGFFKGEPDGRWTPESVAALREFQKAQNLEADGKLGSLSLIALGLGPKRIVSAQNTPPPPPQPQPQP